MWAGDRVTNPRGTPSSAATSGPTWHMGRRSSCTSASARWRASSSRPIEHALLGEVFGGQARCKEDVTSPRRTVIEDPPPRVLSVVAQGVSPRGAGRHLRARRVWRQIQAQNKNAVGRQDATRQRHLTRDVCYSTCQGTGACASKIECHSEDEPGLGLASPVGQQQRFVLPLSCVVRHAGSLVGWSPQ